MLFSAALAVVAAALFSAIPAWRASRSDVQEALREGGRTSAGPGRQHGRNLLVVGELAAALVLVATAGVALKSTHTLLNGPQGFDPDGVLVMDVSLAEARYKDLEKRRAYVREALLRLVELPGVTRAAAANTLPGNGYTSRGIEVESQPLVKGQEPPEVDACWASDAIFATLRVPILEGRGFESTDDEKAPTIAVVSKDVTEPWLQVVGVSGDVIQQWLMRRNAPTFYQPLAQQPRLGLSFAVRGAGEPEALAMPARRALQRVDADQPAYDVQSLRRLMARSTIGLRYVAAIMAAFGVLALVLAVSGVYGVMSYRVSLRTTEIGVRVALGATRLDVLRLTLGQALRLSGVGLVLGSALALAAGRVLASTLRGAVAADPAVLAAVTAFLAAAAFVAAWVPAQRALGVDPAIALRAE